MINPESSAVAHSGSDTEPALAKLSARIAELERQGQTLRSLQADLQAELARYTRVLRGTSDAVWDRNLITGEEYLSPRGKEMLGYTDAELANTAQVFYDHVHPDDLERIQSALVRHLLQRVPYDVELRLRTKDGSYRWIRLRGQAEWDPQGVSQHIAGTFTDITPQRKDEAARWASEARFRATFEQAAVGIAHVALDGHWLRMNQKLCDIVGYSAEELSRLTFQDITHPDDLEADAHLVKCALAGEIPNYVLDKRYIRKDRSIVWIELTVSLMRDQLGAPLYFISVVCDISARKQAEAAAAKWEHRYEATVNASGQMLYEWDPAAGTVTYGGAAMAVLGLPADALPPRLGHWIKRIHPDDQASFITAANLAVARKQSFLLDFRVRHENGSYPEVRCEGHFLYDATSNIERMIGFVRDISAQKQAEMALRESAARYRELFDANPHPMLIYDVETLRFLAVNQAAVTRYGYGREEFLAMTIEAIRPPQDLPALRALLSTGPPYQRAPGVWRHLLRDGRIIEVDVTSQPIQFDGRNARVVRAMDVTEQRRAARAVLESQQTLRALLARLRQAQEAERLRISREIHDELGQLLTGLKMDLRWLERQLTGPGPELPRSRLLERVLAAAALSDATIVTVQKIATNLRPSVLDHLGLTGALAQRARELAERSGIRCAFTVGETLPQLPAEIAGELYYICQEALTNVVRHARATQVAVHLALTGGAIVLTMRDDGVGLPAAEPMTSASLGMAGMRERAALHGGTVKFECGPAGGTIVVASIPLPDQGGASTRADGWSHS